MANTLRAACIQFSARARIEPNLATSLRLAREAAGRGAQLIALPEYFSGVATEGHRIVPTAFAEADHPAIPAFKAAARELGAWMLLGSLAVVKADGKIANRGYLIDPAGAVTARYDKIHLFDVDLGAGKQLPRVRDDRAGLRRRRGRYAVGRPRPLDLLRPALSAALPRARQSRRDDARGAGGVHRS